MHAAFSLGQSLIDGVVTQTDGIYVGLSRKKKYRTLEAISSGDDH